jgi:hypothetical protein
MNIKALAQKLGAHSIDKVAYKSTVKHVCVSGGNVLQMRTIEMERLNHYTNYAVCPHCKRMFYATKQRETVTQKAMVLATV